MNTGDKNRGSRESPGGGGSQRRKQNLTNVKLTREGLRTKREAEANAVLKKEKSSVSAGPVDKVIELAFNPSREKLREVTIIDRMQGRMFPLIDTMNALFLDCIKVAVYRQSPEDYPTIFDEAHPPPLFDIMGEYLYRTAQWQKSIAGKNLERATDIALAETEKGAEEDEPYATGRGFED